ncbi:ribonuclease HII [Alsobacter sp. R-9]
MARIARSAASSITVRSGPDFAREAALIRSGHVPVAGIDEVGRGPLAGPVVAAAVILDPDRLPTGLDDSKALTAERREQLFDVIMATSDVAVASVPASRIDAINIRAATLEAMRRAVAGLRRPPLFLLVDGRDVPACPVPGEAVVGGDARVASIAAASIVAKVTRDRLMARLGRHYPDYGFERHAGYATAAHRAAIRAVGPCPYHRLSFGPLFAAEGQDGAEPSLPA